MAEEWEKSYDNYSAELKAISDYTVLSFSEVMDLPYSLFLLYRRDTWVYVNSRTDNGRKFLRDLVRFKTTEADMQAVHAFKGGAFS